MALPHSGLDSRLRQVPFLSAAFRHRVCHRAAVARPDSSFDERAAPTQDGPRAAPSVRPVLRLPAFIAWPARSLLRNAARWLGRPAAFRSADRCLLEDTILRRYAGRAARQRVLFVGTRWYTRSCERILAGHGYLSLDIDPRAARHGSRQGHVTACASRAAACFEAGSFDVIVFNGVFGWGLDERATVEATVRGFHRLLRDGGELVVGWNDVALRRPFAFGELQALQAFERFAWAPGGPAVLEVAGPNRHRFEFFRKAVPRHDPAAADATARA